MEIKMTIIYEKVDDLIQASVAELPGAISLGSSVEEARQNLGEAIEMVLEDRADGARILMFSLKTRRSAKKQNPN